MENNGITIFVTNEKSGIYKKPISMKGFNYNPKNKELSNGFVSYHVFDKLPYMRDIPVNAQWFETNKYHLS